MPEGLEAEIYRRRAEEVVGREIETVTVDDHQELAAEIRSALPGSTVEAVRRVGKLVIADLDPVGALGLHFGMTGRLIVDGDAAIEQLEYASGRDDSAWDRLVLSFTETTGGGTLRINDPRRWARFTLAPDVDRLGVDLFDVTAEYLSGRLARRQIALKAALLDQSLVAGLGNMLVDDLLFHTRLSPKRPANSMTDDEIERLVAAMRDRLPDMLARGGSHQGDLTPEVRAEQPPCPHESCAADPQPLRRDQIGGRTTIWCPDHQL